MSNKFKEELSRMETGSVALVYSDPNSDLTVEVLTTYIFVDDLEVTCDEGGDVYECKMVVGHELFDPKLLLH